MTVAELKQIKKEDEVITAFTREILGKDRNGFNTYQTVYANPPVRYQVIHTDENSKLAVLKNLAYVKPTN